MKLNQVNLDNLGDGVYYYCANCECWFGEPQPGAHHRCPDCGWLWKNARGIYTKKSKTSVMESNQQQKSGGAGWLVVLVILAAGCWGYSVVQPKVSSAWQQFQTTLSNFVRQVERLLEFGASILLSLVALAGTTLLLFALFRALIHLIVLMFLSLTTVSATDEYRPPVQYRASRILREHSVPVGTLTNLVSSFCALFIVSWMFNRPPDGWDFGLQFLIALIIQMVVIGAAG